MIRNYEQIVRGIKENPWLITLAGFETILEIVERRANGERLNYDEIQSRLSGAKGRGGNNQVEAGGGIGLLPLYGPIFPKANLMTEMSGATSLETFQQDFRSLLSNDLVSTIVLDVDSPGGVAYMVPEVAQEIYEARSIKPIVSVANPQAGSAALYLASQANEMYITPSGMVGSIGVIAVHESIKGMQEKLGIKPTFITAGRYKAELAPETELSDEARQYQQGIVNDIYDDFVGAVARGRNATVQDVRHNYGEGRMLNAKTALDVGLVDGVESLDDVLDRLLDNGGKLPNTSVTTATARRLTPRASLDKEKEHSEPGTLGEGGEPIPRDPPEDEQIDEWKQGERWVPGYLPPEESVMNREMLLKYAQRFKIANADELADEELATAVSAKLDDALVKVDEIDEAVSSAEQSLEFSKQYPDQYAELERLKAKDQKNDAIAFANSFARLKDNEGKDTEFGLSLTAREVVEDVHLKMAQGNLVPSDLNHLVEVLASRSAVIEYGERGSSRLPEPKVDVPGTRQETRKLFSEKVKELIEQDGLDRKAAIAEASKRHPELAQAYIAQ
jgi:capsid assembly protease